MRLRWVVFVAHVEVTLNIYQILVGKYESREHLGDENYIKRDRNKRVCDCYD
jgi:hypothetical protein